MASIGVLNVKVELPQETLDLLRAVKDAIDIIEAQPTCAPVHPQVFITNHFKVPRG